MSEGQLSLKDGPRQLEFCQNQVSYCWDIAHIEFVVVVVDGDVCKAIFVSNPTKFLLG